MVITMKKQKDEKIKSLRSCHASIAALCVMGVLAVIFIENWGEMVVWLPIAFAVFFDGKYEKVDELAKQNLAKANTITMWMLFAAMIIFGMYARYHAIPVSFIIIVICSVLAIRSILFLIFDTSFGGTEETDG